LEAPEFAKLIPPNNDVFVAFPIKRPDTTANDVIGYNEFAAVVDIFPD
jgi:hypothetical protein